jgi:3',5'-cyclic-AMP phosphodiesterase
MARSAPEGDSLTAQQRRLQNRETVTDLRIAEHPRPDHFLLHFSDTHFVGGDRRLYDRVDSEAHLRRLADEFAASGQRPEAIVFTGDLADHGEPDAYARLRDIVEPFADRLGAEVIWCMGNHDERSAFRAALLDESPTTEPVDRVHDVDGLRVIVLDSTVPGHHHGEIAQDQLAWLADVLATPAPHGSVLALHHPPVPSVQDLAVLVELRGQARLAEVLRGSDVRAILGGHLHYSTSATFAGIPVSVASATCYTQDLTVAARGTRAQNGAQAFNLVHVYPDTVMHSVVPVGGHPEVSYVSPEETARRLEAANVLIPPAATAPAARGAATRTASRVSSR